MTKKIFSTRLRALRKEFDLTQSELANAIRIPYGTINGLEIGKNYPNTDTLLTIAKFFNVTLDYLFGLSDNPHKNDIDPLVKSA
jgi:transcriptional regulator with XRE-family HTH domain